MSEPFERLLRRDSLYEKPSLFKSPDVALDWMEVRRETLIKELRTIDKILVENGRLKEETLARRVR